MRGEYALRAYGQLAELEWVEVNSLSRSVMYCKDGETTYLVVPHGVYDLHVAPLELAGDDVEPVLEIESLSLVGKARFYLEKVAALARRGNIAALRGAIRSRLAGIRTIVGVRLETRAASAFPAPAIGRPTLAPATPVDTKVSIIIPTKERFDLLRACVESLERIENVETELVVVNNGATAPQMIDYLDTLRERPRTRVLDRPAPFNFSWLCNEGAGAATAPVLLFMNDDVEALDGTWLKWMLAYLARDDVGIVGPRLLYPSGELQHAGIASNLVPGPGHPWLGSARENWQKNPFVMQSGEVDAVTAACLMIRRSTFDLVGGFDETTFPITVNDVDLCLRAHALGLKIVYVAEAELIHRENQTRRPDDRPEERSRRGLELRTYFERHGVAARHSVFYPKGLRRDTDAGLPI